jgi:toxin CcdB
MAAQFDVFANPDPQTAESHPYFIVLQSRQLAHLNTRIVAPLIAPNIIPGFERLTPIVSINGTRYMIDVTNIGVVPTKLISNPLANLEAERYRIVAAIDLVFTGI